MVQGPRAHLGLPEMDLMLTQYPKVRELGLKLSIPKFPYFIGKICEHKKSRHLIVLPPRDHFILSENCGKDHNFNTLKTVI
jgi:hypothetical protein